MRTPSSQAELPSRSRIPNGPSAFDGHREAVSSSSTGGIPTRHSTSAAQAPSRHNQVSRDFFKNATGKRIDTDAVVVEAIRADYPELHLTVVPIWGCNVAAWAGAGFAGLAPIDNEKDRLWWKTFIPPANRLGGSPGFLADNVQLGKFLLDWKGKEYIMYIIEGRDGPFSATINQYLLSPSIESTNRLLMEAGIWNNQLHNEIWVFDQGFWQKSAELYNSIRDSSWDDVILDESMKDALIADVERFFDSRDTYEGLRVPWKRGIIYYGPPGNGKTISIKAMMSMLYKRKDPIPTLYVKTLKSFFGPEDSINEIFGLARRTAPCYLVFEDLDSIVSDDVRSFFLNAVDGIQKNDGILMVGSTNHLDRLDPGIAKRPSRFDRKWQFPNPNVDERTLYMQYWQRKLKDSDVEFPDKICPAAAKITKGFSFAYLQEVMVAALLVLARDADSYSERTCLECMETHEKPKSGMTCDRDSKRPFKGLYDWVWSVRQLDDEDPDLDDYILWREVKKQVRILREELETEKVVKN